MLSDLYFNSIWDNLKSLINFHVSHGVEISKSFISLWALLDGWLRMKNEYPVCEFKGIIMRKLKQQASTL